MKFVDPDGRIVKIAHWEKTILGITFKSPNYIKAEKAINLLRSTNTGEKIYNDLNDRKEIVYVRFGDIKERDYDKILGNEYAGQNSAVKKIQENGQDKVTEALVEVDESVANQDWNTQGGKTKNAGSAITLGHEFGHTKSMLDNLDNYKDESKKGTAEDVQAIPTENAVRSELRYDEYERNKQ